MDFIYPHLLQHFINIGIALAIGLLIGSERGWQERDGGEGSRVAGIRTFTLVALFGGFVSATTSNLGEFYRWVIAALAFLPLSVLLVAGYLQYYKRTSDLSITTQLAAMMTFWLGVLPGMGYALPAAASAVVLSLILHSKSGMHKWLNYLDDRELTGTLQFLLVSVVILPMLPNQGYGPWKFFNPYELWWMVVLISGISLVGYFAMRFAGARKGVIATSLTGGLVSSTAVTLSLSRLHKEVGQTEMIGAGILLANGVMFARMLLVAGVMNPQLVLYMLLPLGTGIVILLSVAWWYGRSASQRNPAPPPEIHNPFQLIPALQFAGLLALVMLGAEGLQVAFGEAGLYGLSVFTGLADVDAIVLSLSPKAPGELNWTVVVLSLSLAGATNTLVKGIYCRVIAGSELGWRVLIPSVLTSLLVLLMALLSLWWL